MKKIFVVLMVLLFAQMLCFASSSYNPRKFSKGPDPDNTDRHKQERLTKALDSLNKAIQIDYSQRGEELVNPYQFLEMFSLRITVIPLYTKNHYFTTYDGIKYTMYPLKDICPASSDVSSIGANTACAKIVIQFKEIRDKYQVFLYKDAVLPRYSSTEERLLDGNF